MKSKKKQKKINPIARSRVCGEHGPRAVKLTHKNLKKYTRKNKKSSYEDFFYFV